MISDKGKKIYLQEYFPYLNLEIDDDQPELSAELVEEKPEFLKNLRSLINCNSLENISNTPDFILAEFLEDCLIALNKAINKREEWYDRQPESYFTQNHDR